MPFTIVQSDITKMRVDAIVNAANTALQMGGGVCGAIFWAAGARELQAECDAIGGCETGKAVITKGYALPAKYVIHTPGPVYAGGGHGEAEALRSCYASSLELAKENACASIAFPLISSGIFGYPKREALHVATQAIRSFLHAVGTDGGSDGGSGSSGSGANAGEEMDVYLAVMDKSMVEVGAELLGGVEAYIGVNLATLGDSPIRPSAPPPGSIRRATSSDGRAREMDIREARPPTGAQSQGYITAQASPRMAGIGPIVSRPAGIDSIVGHPAGIGPIVGRPSGLDAIVGHLDEPFSQTLLKLIDAKGRTDADVYKRANLDRRHFSKIRSNMGYAPSKKTAVALAVALELNMAETRDLLERAGYALSRSQKFDIIIEYFIQNRNYDIYEINEVLFHYDQPLLGA
jgi:O-acetyl-ADP-ribose deacetylase (regulator of RNase III)